MLLLLLSEETCWNVLGLRGEVEEVVKEHEQSVRLRGVVRLLPLEKFALKLFVVPIKPEGRCGLT